MRRLTTLHCLLQPFGPAAVLAAHLCESLFDDGFRFRGGCRHLRIEHRDLPIPFVLHGLYLRGEFALLRLQLPLCRVDLRLQLLGLCWLHVCDRFSLQGGQPSLGGQYGALWGADYRQVANANMMIVAMIESPAGVEIADQIAAIPGVDVVFVASTDLGSFSGYKQGQPEYEALVTKIKDAVLKNKKILAGPLAWKDRPGYHFFQGPGETALLRQGAKLALGGANEGAPKGVAAIEGSEKK